VTVPLTVVVRAHLGAHPWLTAYEVGRATGQSMGGVRDALTRMEAAGTAVRREVPRTPSDSRPRVEWRVT
jgi:hypothetical protein